LPGADQHAAAGGFFYAVGSIIDYFEGRAKLRRHWQMRQRQMLNERIYQSDSARRLLDDLNRQFRNRR